MERAEKKRRTFCGWASCMIHCACDCQNGAEQRGVRLADGGHKAVPTFELRDWAAEQRGREGQLSRGQDRRLWANIAGL